MHGKTRISNIRNEETNTLIQIRNYRAQYFEEISKEKKTC